MKVLRIVTDLGRTKVFVLHHRNARRLGVQPKGGWSIDRVSRKQTAARKSLPGSESQRFRLVSKLRTWHWRTCSNTTEKTYSSSSPREGKVGARHTAGVHGRADERGHDTEKRWTADRHWNAPAANLLHGCAPARRDDATRWTASRVPIVSMDPLLCVKVVGAPYYNCAA